MYILPRCSQFLTAQDSVLAVLAVLVCCRPWHAVGRWPAFGAGLVMAAASQRGTERTGGYRVPSSLWLCLRGGMERPSIAGGAGDFRIMTTIHGVGQKIGAQRSEDKVRALTDARPGLGGPCRIDATTFWRRVCRLSGASIPCSRIRWPAISIVSPSITRPGPAKSARARVGSSARTAIR